MRNGNGDKYMYLSSVSHETSKMAFLKYWLFNLQCYGRSLYSDIVLKEVCSHLLKCDRTTVIQYCQR